ncbi:MAG: hypothetical protein IPP44_26670 [Ideonella sp.]|jgi:predicted small lipoprotein YifL|nr:hypothetical protein [Ideonella sp.]
MKITTSLAIRTAGLLLLALMAAGCGQKGALTLPGQGASAAMSPVATASMPSR